jgi:ribosomal protein RSM22 (predicted rRNA methylase)
MHPYFQFPEPLIKIIETFCLKETGYQSTDDFIKNFSPEIAKVSDLFNQRTGSDNIASTLSYPHFPIAYIAYFLPANFFKIAALILDFHRAAPFHPFFSRQEEASSERPFRVLDLGAGPGTNGLGLLDFMARFSEPFFKNRQIEYLAVDQDPRQLRNFSLLFSIYFPTLEAALSKRGIQFKIQTVQKKISTKQTASDGKFDLIILGNLLNEMIQNGQSISSLSEWVKNIMNNKLTSVGALFIIEPALRKASRNLLALRDLLALQKKGSIAAPCLHQQPCPIMGTQGSEKDWCHQEKEWAAPEWIQQIDREIGNRKDAFKYSYLILSDPETVPEHPPFRWRVVSEVMETKGKKEAFLCNETGRTRFYLLDREVSDSNHFFSTVKRGEIVEITGPERLEGTRILPDWRVIID